MSSRFAIVLALGCMGLADASLMAQRNRRGDPDASQYGWLPSLEEGKAQARRSGKPLMVVVRCVP